MPYITESKLEAFKAALQFIRSIKPDAVKNKADSITGRKNAVYSPGLTRSSIMKASKDLVMSFPVLCSDTLQPETAAMITKAIERNCVTQLQMIFSASYLKGANGFDIINQWHKNMDDSIGLDDYISMIDSISYTVDNNGKINSHDLYKKVSGSKPAQNIDAFLKAVGEMTQIKEAMCKAVQENNRYYPESSFSENSIGAFQIKETYNGFDVVFSPIHENNNDFYINPYGNGMKFGDYYYDSKSQIDIDAKFAAYQQSKTEEEHRHQERMYNIGAGNKRHRDEMNFRKDEAKYRKEKDEAEMNYRKDKDASESMYRAQRDRIIDDREAQKAASLALRDETELFTRRLMDNDVKKCNELVPSMIIIRFNVAGTETGGSAAIEQQFVAGIKARLIPCASEEIIDRLRVVLMNKVSRVNWVRATTGEISFMKDFIMGIEQAKIDAKRNSSLSKTSPIWRTLQHRSAKSTMNRLRRNKANDAGAITTLVLNATEVNALKKAYNIDLYNISTVQEVMENYNFMGVVIVDEDMEVARFLFDGEKYFQDISFTSLERETGDGSYKKVVNLISKINRG